MPTANAGFNDGLSGLPGRQRLADQGPVLYVHVGFDPAYLDGQPGRPNIPAIPLHALVDTGSEKSCVDSRIAEGLGLPVVETRMMSSPHGVAEVNVHSAQIYVPDLDFVMSGSFTSAHLIAGGQPYFALLGRDFLSNFTMVYEGGTGLVAISND